MNALPASPTQVTAPLPCLSIVMPVYDEAATVGQMVQAVLAQPLVKEIIVVDDGSMDGL